VAPARTGMAYPLFGTSATHAAALWAHWGPEKTAAFYRTLKESGVRVVDGNSVVRDLVVSGELLAGLTDSDDACEAVARGAKVRLVVPDQDGEGTLLIPGTVALIRGGPDRENARRLADFLTSAEAERMLIASGFVQVSLRPGGPVAPCLAGREIKTLPVDLERVRQSLEPSRAAMTGIFLR
jgi:iron(III) transport system substrate-binding protein